MKRLWRTTPMFAYFQYWLGYSRGFFKGVKVFVKVGSGATKLLPESWRYEAPHGWRYRYCHLFLTSEHYEPAVGAEIEFYDVKTNERVAPYFGFRLNMLAGDPLLTDDRGMIECFLDRPCVTMVVRHPEITQVRWTVVLASHVDDPALSPWEKEKQR